MAFTARFYTLSKKDRSTLQPSGGTDFNINLKAGCDILNPIIELQLGQSDNPTAYNYCYIPAFQRFYYIKWKWENRLWNAYGDVDPLASWKTHIGASTEFVSRCAGARNESIIDNLYPLTTVRAINKKSLTTPFTDDIDNGMFIIGVMGYSPSGVGATQYYAMSNDRMRNLCYQLLSDINYMNLDFTEISEQLSRAIINPTQYLASCIWVPFKYSAVDVAGSLSDIEIGWWTPGAKGYKLHASELCWRYSTAIGDLPKHPSGVLYKYLKPYTRYYLDFPPFGYIDIDPSDFVNTTNMAFDISVDLISGLGTLRIQDTAGNDNPVYGLYTSQVGVPMALSSNTQNYLSTGLAIAQGALALGTGGIAGAILGSGAIGNVADAISSKIQTLGSNGGMGLYKAPPKLTCIFQYGSTEDPTHFGYPYMAPRQINTLSGYIKCESADPSIPCTDVELQKIISYMNEGFYYE